MSAVPDATGYSAAPPRPVMFPVQRDRRALEIPWRIAERAYRAHCRRYGRTQTIEQLAEHGGFGVLEVISLLAGGDGSWDGF